MSTSGIDQVTFGVEDLDPARRFFADFGLTKVAADDVGATFATIDGGQVRIRPASAAELPPAFEPGPTLREVIWGCADKQALAETVAALRGVPSLDTGADGIVRCTDPNGLRLGFRVSQRKPVVVEPTAVNAPGTPRRINQSSLIHDAVRPINIGHVVLFVSNLEESSEFYQSRLGFVVSDRYPKAGIFLRCQPTGGHHNLFLLERPGKQGLNHVAFTVRDLHEVVGGGLAMSGKGWQTDIGPGRHPISSALFWYFKSPCGGSAEYYADEDYLTSDWRPRDFVRSPENYIEWAFAGGIDLGTRRQKLQSSTG
jgi:catechol 2,3-dioxygenase-like lactoylglutathione lyase family enzyme